MSEPEHTVAEEAVEVVKRAALPTLAIALVVGLVLLVVATFGGARYLPLLPQARAFIEARTDGLKIGRFGRLKIEGLGGDVWRDFTIRRLTVRDEKGVWLEASNLHMRWRYAQLFRRRFDADLIEARSVRLIRRPTLTPKGKDSGLPVSFQIDRVHARVEMAPGFSYRRGLYDLDASLSVERRGGQQARVRAASLLHPGDHLNLDLDVSPTRPLVLIADAEEAQGGALAGALGLSPSQPFDLKVVAGGKASQGRFTAVATTGALQPLKAVGAWTPAGGEASGGVLLTASALSRPWADRFGPQVRFGVAGRKAGKDLYALSARLYGDNLSLRADGLGDLLTRRIGPDGLKVAAATDGLSRITGGPDMGPARLAGVVTGQGGAWRFAGSGAVARVKLGAYSLADAAGPLRLALDRGTLSASANLTGRGGAGSGWVAALLGGAPRASFEGAKLPDGRLALKRLDLTGQGLKLQASGGRSLLGGLTFKGRADLSNLASARTGASGAATAEWSASQSGAGKPWLLAMDARAEGFATGYAELDRLLGARPRLAVQAAVRGGEVAVSRAALDGAALQATTAGQYARGALSFKVDWNATGPFRAGPVEVAGKARGTGALTGRLSEPRIDLIADVDQLDVPRLPLTKAHVTLSFLRKADGSSGMIAATADSPYGPARARSDFRFPAQGVDLSGLSVEAAGLTATGSVSLRRGQPSAADLQLAVGRGAFLEAGRIAGAVRIVDAPGGARATLDLTGQDARLPGTGVTLTRARLTADGPLARLPYAAEAQGAAGSERWSFSGRGVVSETLPGYAATFDGAGRAGQRDLRTVETATFRFGGPELSARVRLAGPQGGRIDLDGRQTREAADVRLQVANLSLGLLDPDLAGRVDGGLTLGGRGAALAGVLDAKLTDARGRGAPASSSVDAVLRGRLANATLTLDASATNAQGMASTATLFLPTEASAAPLRLAIARNRPMRGEVHAQGEVRPLWDLLVGGDRSLAGQVKADLTLAGTLNDPLITGAAELARGRFDHGPTGLSLRDVSMGAQLDRGVVRITHASGVDGHGGTVGIAPGAYVGLRRGGDTRVKLQLAGFRMIDNERATASATGQVTIRRAASGRMRLATEADDRLVVDRADVAADPITPSGVVAMDVIEKNRPADLPVSLPPAASGGYSWDVDVAFTAPRRVFLRGRGLDVELSLDAHVAGTTQHPSLSGTARVVRGDYDFAGKRFEFDERSVVYLSTRADEIRLDLTATREDPTLTAAVRIRGTAAKPEVTLTSIPSLPSDEVLSQVLFGRSASQLSPLEAAQLASAISALAGGGGFDVVGNLRAFAGLDRLAFAGGGDAGGITVAGGKYLTDDVYLELIGGSRDGPAAQIEWRVRRNLSILSRVTGQGASKLAVRWRRDY